MLSKAKKWAKYLGEGFLFAMLFHTIITCVDGLWDDDSVCDVAVVLGNKVNEDGSLSPRLMARLNKAVELYQNKKIKNIIVSGGLGKEGFYEGDKMKEYLIKQNIPDSLIIVDNKGDNTLKTVQNTIAICKSKGFKSVVAISQYYHISRIKSMFKHEGKMYVNGASPCYFEWRDAYSIFREFFAYYAYLL